VIERLGPGDRLCHGNLHPANVIMTADDPRLIDWGGATRAPAGLDLACCHFLQTEFIPERVPDPERPRATNAAMQSEYARLVGMSRAALTAAMEPCLPIDLRNMKVDEGKVGGVGHCVEHHHRGTT
jgi:Phosphotransferase enzyme family